MSYRRSDGDLTERIADLIRRVDRVEHGVHRTLTTRRLILRSSDGEQKYVIEAGSWPGSLEIYDARTAEGRVVIEIP